MLAQAVGGAPPGLPWMLPIGARSNNKELTTIQVCIVFLWLNILQVLIVHGAFLSTGYDENWTPTNRALFASLTIYTWRLCRPKPPPTSFLSGQSNLPLVVSAADRRDGLWRLDTVKGNTFVHFRVTTEGGRSFVLVYYYAILESMCKQFCME